MRSRDATVGDLRTLNERMKNTGEVSSLDWIASGAFTDSDRARGKAHRCPARDIMDRYGTGAIGLGPAEW
jgi:hypothetical protein